MPDFPILLPSLIIFTAFFVRALTGFGGALISVPLLAFFFDLKFVIPMELIFQTVFGIVLIRPVRHAVAFNQLGPLMIGLFAGNMIGAHMLANFANERLKVALALVVLLFAGYMAYTSRQPLHLGLSSKWGVGCGFIGGIFGGLFGMSGPLVVLYLAHQIENKEVFRATLIALFLASSLWSAGLYWYHSLFSWEMFQVALALSPAFLLGIVLGYWAHFQVSESFFRLLIAGILFVAGVLLLQGSV